MSILLPVNPTYAGMLVDGVKTIEWRTKPLPKGIAYTYETKRNGGCGMVIGEVTVWASYKVEVDKISDEWMKYGKVNREFLKLYAGGKPLYANLVEKAKRYEKPIPLSEFKRANRTEETSPCAHAKWLFEPCETCKECNLKRPPQSWCYVEERE